MFTPAANAHGTGYASFTFRVSDGTAQSASTYTMTVDVRPDDTLDALALSAGTLAPTFAAATEAYTASVANNVARITVTATASQDAATVEFLDSNDAPLGDADAGTNGRQVDLDGRGQHGEDPGDARRPRQDEDLHGGGDARGGGGRRRDADRPGAERGDARLRRSTPATENYTASVAKSVARITVTPTASQTAATVAYLNAGNAALGDADPATAGQQADLTSGENTIRVKVTAPDGATAKTYTVVVTRMTANAAPTGADLTILADPDTGYIFRAVDFGFADTDEGDTLASVTIWIRPAVGSLTLDGTRVLSEQVVAVADIDAGKLKYTSGIDQNRVSYAAICLQCERRHGGERLELHCDHRFDWGAKSIRAAVGAGAPGCREKTGQRFPVRFSRAGVPVGPRGRRQRGDGHPRRHRARLRPHRVGCGEADQAAGDLDICRGPQDGIGQPGLSVERNDSSGGGLRGAGSRR